MLESVAWTGSCGTMVTMTAVAPAGSAVFGDTPTSRRVVAW